MQLLTILIISSFHIFIVGNPISQEISGHNSVFFIKSKAVHTTQSKWLTTFLLDIDPYVIYIETVEGNVNKLRLIVQQYSEKGYHLALLLGHEDTAKNDHSKNHPYFDMYNQRLDVFTKKIDEFKEMLHNVELLIAYSRHPSRNKRALLSFLGDILGAITGVATDKQIKVINERINQLVDHDLELAHVIEKGISVVNATRVKLSETIETVNSLIEVTNSIQYELFNVTKVLQNQIMSFQKLVYHWNQITLYFNLIQDAMETVQHQFQTLHMQINAILQGSITPEVISPRQLQTILHEVAKFVPNYISLPYDIRNEIMEYYKALKCTSIPQKHGIMVIMSIPLLSERSRFIMYRILNVPVPFASGNLSAKYDIGHKYIALSEDTTQYAALDESEYYHCTLPDIRFCSIRKAIKYVSKVLSKCEFGLLIDRDPHRCGVKVFQSQADYPQATYIDNGNWVITTQTELTFTTLCPNAVTRTIKVSPPIGTVRLEIGCRAHSVIMLLPPTYYHKNHVQITTPKLYEKLDMSIWDLHGPKLSFSLKTMPEKVYELTPHPTDLHHLVHKLNELQKKAEASRKKESSKWYFYVIGTLAFIIMVISGMAIVGYKYKMSTHMLRLMCCKLKKSPPVKVSSNLKIDQAETIELTSMNCKPKERLYPNLATCATTLRPLQPLE